MVQLSLLLSIKLSMKLLSVALMRWDGSLRLDRSFKPFFFLVFFFSGGLRFYMTQPYKLFRLCCNVYGPFAESPYHSFRWWNFTYKRGIMGDHGSFIQVSYSTLTSNILRVITDRFYLVRWRYCMTAIIISFSN